MRAPTGVLSRQRAKAAAVSARFAFGATVERVCDIAGPPVHHERGSHGTGAPEGIHAALPEGHDLPPAGPGCVLALSDPHGRSLRIEWTRAVASEVAAVARSLWEASA